MRLSSFLPSEQYLVKLIILTIFKCIVLSHYIYIFMLVQHHYHHLSPEVFYPFLAPSNLWQPAFYFLSLRIRVLWESHINRIIPYLSFYDWHISLSIMSPQSIYVIAVSDFLFYGSNNTPLYVMHMH